MSRKTFKAGEVVEIKRDTGHCTEWEQATYIRPDPEMSGWHEVALKTPRFVEIWPGRGPTPCDWDLVPSRRIQKVKV